MNKQSRYKLILIAFLAIALGAATACQTSTKPTNNAVNLPANKTENAVNKTGNTETPKQSASSLASPTEAYKAAFDARQKKDIAALKRVLSNDILDFFKEIGEAENKSIDDELKELTEKPQAGTAEVRNEKITGDTATIEYLDENGKWDVMDFVKEGGDWKLTIPDMRSPENKDANKKP